MSDTQVVALGFDIGDGGSGRSDRVFLLRNTMGRMFRSRTSPYVDSACERQIKVSLDRR